jgi:integrase/recombinase XerD
VEEVYDYKRKLKRRIELIEGSSKILEKNKEILIDFHHGCIAEGLSMPRTEKCLCQIYQIACQIKKPFSDCNKEDLIKIVEEIEGKDYSGWTKHDYKVILKKFFLFSPFHVLSIRNHRIAM